MLLESQAKPKKKRLNEGNIFVTMVNPQAVYQMAEPLKFPTDQPIGLYGRQSSLFQFQNRTESRDYQIEEQHKILIRQYLWQEAMIFEYFQDFAESGTLGIGERVGVTRLLEDIKRGFIKAVYVFLVDRLFRDKLLENVIRFAKACYEHKIIIITSCYVYRMWIQDDYEKFIEDCKLAWKALDLQLNKRMLPMRAFASHSGKYDSRSINIGYTVDRDKHSPTYKRYIPLPKHAEIMKDTIFLRLIDYGGDAFALMHELEQQEGVHFPWHDDPLFNSKVELLKIPGVGYRIGTYTTLLHILRNPVYIGTWKTGDKAYPGNHEAIIDENTWDTVQYLLDRRQESIHPQQRNRSYDTLLRGLILRPFPGCIVSVSPHNGEISLAWKDNENRMHPNRRDSIPLATVETMFQEIFTRRVLRDNKCYQYAEAASSLYKAEAKNRKHIQETITGLEGQRRVILDDLEDPTKRAKMSERTVGEKYQKVAEREGEIARLQAVLNRPSKYLPLPDLISLIEQLRRDWNSLPPADIRNVAIVFCKGILLTPRSNHTWSFEVQWELWPSDTGIFWLNVGDKYHWFDEDIATLHALASRSATTEEVLASLPKFSQTAISNMSLRKCGERIVPKGSHRLDAYMTREDMSVLDEYGVAIEPIAEMRGTVKAREFNGSQYWSLAYTKRTECRDIIFFVDWDDGTNHEAIR
jgi:Recombinase/Resolvase, N terminal domain